MPGIFNPFFKFLHLQYPHQHISSQNKYTLPPKTKKKKCTIDWKIILMGQTLVKHQIFLYVHRVQMPPCYTSWTRSTSLTPTTFPRRITTKHSLALTTLLELFTTKQKVWDSFLGHCRCEGMLGGRWAAAMGKSRMVAHISIVYSFSGCNDFDPVSRCASVFLLLIHLSLLIHYPHDLSKNS